MIFKNKITMCNNEYEYTANVFNCQNNKFGINGGRIFELEITLTNETYPNGYKIYSYHYGEVIDNIKRSQDNHVLNMILSHFYVPVNGCFLVTNNPVNVYEYSDDELINFYKKLHICKVNNVNLNIFEDCDYYYEYIIKMNEFVDNNLPFINKDIVDIRDCFMSQSSPSSNRFYYSRYEYIHYILNTMEDIHDTESLGNIIVALYSDETNLVFLYLMGPMDTDAIYLGACTEKDLKDAGLSYNKK